MWIGQERSTFAVICRAYAVAFCICYSVGQTKEETTTKSCEILTDRGGMEGRVGEDAAPISHDTPTDPWSESNKLTKAINIPSRWAPWSFLTFQAIFSCWCMTAAAALADQMCCWQVRGRRKSEKKKKRLSMEWQLRSLWRHRRNGRTKRETWYLLCSAQAFDIRPGTIFSFFRKVQWAGPILIKLWHTAPS